MSSQVTPSFLYPRLSAMMYFQYFTWGAFMVTMPTYFMANLKFSGEQVGLVYSTQAIAAMITPVIIGMIADRFFSTQKVAGICHLSGAALLFTASQTPEFGFIYFLMLGFFLSTMPTVALTTSLTFRHIAYPERDYPRIRVWGTLGWMSASILVGTLKIEDQNLPLMIGAVSGLLMGLYCFTLPDTPPQAKQHTFKIRDAIGLDALKLFRNLSFAALLIFALILNIPRAFYLSFTNAFLNEIGMVNAAGKMSIGQLGEIFLLLLLPWFLKRFGIRKVILFATIGWITRYLLFSFGNLDENAWMLYFGIALHGLCYVYFYLTAQIYVDQKAGPGMKAAAQGLLTFMTSGTGAFIGSIIAGYTVDANLVSEGIHDWQAIWLFPAYMAAFVFVGLFLFFRDDSEQEQA
ncbi:MAG: MFS transporter [Bacteroidota bacterium]